MLALLAVALVASSSSGAAPVSQAPVCLKPGGVCDAGAAIGGGVQNAIGGNGRAFDSFIGAGDVNLIAPPSATAYASDAFIGAGASNTVAAENAAIVAGARNAVQGGFGAVVAGAGNVVKGADAFVGAGSSNVASGNESFVGAGRGNTAAGEGSIALGMGSAAANDGTFVWSDDATGAVALKSSAPNQFLARAGGGVRFFSNAALTSGVSLAPGSGTWSSLSDRAMKTRVAPLDGAAILAKVAALPVSEWSYRSEDPRVRHVGPMAQDFYAAFGVGEDDRHITAIDEDGVALAAIKALAEKARRAENANARLERQVLALAAEVRRLERRR